MMSLPIFRLGWLVPIIVFGTLMGLFLDPAIKGGTRESQMWETVRIICGETIIGLVVAACSAPPADKTDSSEEEYSIELTGGGTAKLLRKN